MSNSVHQRIQERISGAQFYSQHGYYISGSSVPNNTNTVLTFSATSDPHGWLSGGNVVPTRSGLYRVEVNVAWNVNLGGTRHVAAIRLNGTATTIGQDNRDDVGTGQDYNAAAVVVTCNGTSDTISVALLQISGAQQNPSIGLFVSYLPGL